MIVLLLLAVFAAGCAGIDMPTPETVLKNPLGTDTIKIGMTKDEVVNFWGEPDYVDYEETEGTEKGREVWTYKARYSRVPVDAGYLSKTRYLYFDGKNLTKISD